MPFPDSQVSIRQAVDAGDDEAIDWIYPPEIRALSARHWTPIEVARRAAAYLVPREGVRVLDIGCGPGKFCLVGAIVTQGIFTGVEQRESLVIAGQRAIEEARIPNAEILHANILEIEFSGFDAFYLYNPFAENLAIEDRIDSSIVLSKSAHRRYTDHVANQMESLPAGTRVACYWGGFDGADAGFELEDPTAIDLLEFWRKKS